MSHSLLYSSEFMRDGVAHLGGGFSSTRPSDLRSDAARNAEQKTAAEPRTTVSLLKVDFAGMRPGVTVVRIPVEAGVP